MIQQQEVKSFHVLQVEQLDASNHFQIRLNLKTCFWPKSKVPASGSRKILQEKCGKVTGSCRKTPEIPGTGSSVPAENCPDFFRWIPIKFLCVSTGTGRKSSEKVPKNFFGLVDLGKKTDIEKIIIFRSSMKNNVWSSIWKNRKKKIFLNLKHECRKNDHHIQIQHKKLPFV